MKKLWISRTLAMLLTTAMLFVGCGGVQAATMYLRKVAGSVGVSDSEGRKVDLLENMGLYSGYGVDTQAESYAWIDLDKVKLAKLDQNSEIAIEKEGKSLEIEVKAGSLFFNVIEPLAEDETMEIRTSNMMVGIRGTCGWVEVLDSGHMALSLLEGKVECTAGGNTATVSAGERAEMSPDGDISISVLYQESIPAFVQEEVSGEEKLAQAVGQLESDPFAPYADILKPKGDGSTLVYAGIWDFEGDGSPELLTLTLRWKAADLANDELMISIYRAGPDGVEHVVYHDEGSVHSGATYSLAESEGQMFVMRHSKYSERSEDSVTTSDSLVWSFLGFISEKDGGQEDWGLIESLRYERSSSYTVSEYKSYQVLHNGERQLASGGSWEDCSYEDFQARLDRYKEVCTLATVGEDGKVTVVAPQLP